MKTTVVVPTFRRPESLVKCLAGLAGQTQRPSQVIVVTRKDDEPSRAAASTFASQVETLGLPSVEEGGVVAAMNAGLELATGDIVGLIDDDAVPAPDWWERINASFAANPQIGGVGGRDNVFIHGRGETGAVSRVGLVSWVGRVSGGHHLGHGPPREVEVLKGVNCAFRREPLLKIRFDRRLRGEGAQVHWELALCLALRRAGWKLLYDPAITVDHYPALRHDNDQRGQFDAAACRDAAHNETLALAMHFVGFQRYVFLVWALFIGSRGAPGLFQALRLAIHGNGCAGRALAATWRGRFAGWIAASKAP